MTDRNVILWDIDGVLADCHHRLHHILEKPVDWDSFDELTLQDKPILEMIRLLNLCACNPFVETILITGRADRNNVRADTTEWLCKNGITSFNLLLMRGEKDRRSALKVKLGICDTYGYTPDRVITLFEDQPETITGFRKAGYHVCDVGGWKDNYTEILTEGGPG